MHVRIGGTSGGEQWQGYKELFDGVVFAAREERDKSNLESIMTEAVQSEGGAVQRKGRCGLRVCASVTVLCHVSNGNSDATQGCDSSSCQIVTIGLSSFTRHNQTVVRLAAKGILSYPRPSDASRSQLSSIIKHTTNRSSQALKHVPLRTLNDL